jgi:hypothetical protein
MLDVQSTIRGSVWPAIPGPFVSQLLAMQYQFEASQWLTPDEILRRQTRQLGRLLAHAFDTVPYYRARLEEAGLGPDRVRAAEQWLRIPLLTRFDIQRSQEKLASAAVPGFFRNSPPTTWPAVGYALSHSRIGRRCGGCWAAEPFAGEVSTHGCLERR